MNILIKQNNINVSNLVNNIILSTYWPEEGNDVVMQRSDNFIYHITNTKTELELLKNKSNFINNISIIDLGDF